jgi:hypothetical protein
MIGSTIAAIVNGGLYMGWGWGATVLAIFALLLAVGIRWWLATDASGNPKT